MNRNVSTQSVESTRVRVTHTVDDVIKTASVDYGLFFEVRAWHYPCKGRPGHTVIETAVHVDEMFGEYMGLLSGERELLASDIRVAETTDLVLLVRERLDMLTRRDWIPDAKRHLGLTTDAKEAP